MYIYIPYTYSHNTYAISEKEIYPQGIHPFPPTSGNHPPHAVPKRPPLPPTVCGDPGMGWDGVTPSEVYFHIYWISISLPVSSSLAKTNIRNIIYLYVYMYIHTCIYIYIYLYDSPYM